MKTYILIFLLLLLCYLPSGIVLVYEKLESMDERTMTGQLR